MLGRLWTLVSFPLLVIVVIIAISASLLGMGTLLTFVFAVTVWEATIVVTVVTIAAVWFIIMLGPPPLAEPYVADHFDDEEPDITITGGPVRAPRRSRRRRR